MREMRQVWVEPNEVRGGETVQVGRLTTLLDATDNFALRRWDNTEPLQADTVVKVVEIRPYGSLLVMEVGDGDVVLRGIDRIRRELAGIEKAPPHVREEYREEIGKLTALVDRFPVPVQWVEA